MPVTFTFDGIVERPSSMKILRLLATVFSLGIAALGVLGIAAPALLIQLGHSLIQPPTLYAVAAIRVAFGALLMLVAAGSRMPRTLRAVGVLIVVAGLLTPFVGPMRFDDVLVWFSEGRLNVLRGVALLPVAGGLLLAYALNPRRGAKT